MQSREASAVQTIYHLAKQQEEAILRHWLTENNVLIGMLDNGVSATRRLAQDGEFAAVRFLLDHFDASSFHAILGAAEGKHHAQVKEFVVGQLGNPCAAIAGFARVGDHDAVKEYCQYFKNRWPTAKPTNAMILGYSRSNNIGHIPNGIEGDDFDTHILGLVEGGYLERAKSYADTHAKILAYAHAFINHPDVTITPETPADIRLSILDGWTAAGLHHKVHEILGITPMRQELDVVAARAAVCFHTQVVNQSIKRGATIAIVARAYSRADYLNTPQKTLHVLCLTEDSALRLVIAKEGQARAYFKIDDMLDKAELIRNLMKTYSLSFGKAHIWFQKLNKPKQLRQLKAQYFYENPHENYEPITFRKELAALVMEHAKQAPLLSHMAQLLRRAIAVSEAGEPHNLISKALHMVAPGEYAETAEVIKIKKLLQLAEILTDIPHLKTAKRIIAMMTQYSLDRDTALSWVNAQSEGRAAFQLIRMEYLIKQIQSGEGPYLFNPASVRSDIRKVLLRQRADESDLERGARLIDTIHVDAEGHPDNALSRILHAPPQRHRYRLIAPPDDVGMIHAAILAAQQTYCARLLVDVESDDASSSEVIRRLMQAIMGNDSASAKLLRYARIGESSAAMELIEAKIAVLTPRECVSGLSINT